MDTEIDVHWIAGQAGVPASFLIGIPIFLLVVLTLVSKVGTKERENYNLGRQVEVDRSGRWLAPVGLFILMCVVVTSYTRIFL